MIDRVPMLQPRPSEIRFVISGNPISQNQAWDFIIFRPKKEDAAKGAQGHISKKLTPDAVKFKHEVGRITALARPNDWDRDNEYEVTAVYFFDTRRPDCDGPGKLLLDALGEFDLAVDRVRTVSFTGLWKNDRQVWRFVQQKELDREQPRAEITVKLRKPWKPQQSSLAL